MTSDELRERVQNALGPIMCDANLFQSITGKYESLFHVRDALAAAAIPLIWDAAIEAAAKVADKSAAQDTAGLNQCKLSDEDPFRASLATSNWIADAIRKLAKKGAT